MKLGRKNSEIVSGSGNVFADLGLPNPEEHLIKANLVNQIHLTIKKKKWSDEKAAEAFGLTPEKLDSILSGHFTRYSTDRLLGFLNKLGMDVDIVVKKKQTREPGQVRVVMV